jgi:acid stress chaperone HdeA
MLEYWNIARKDEKIILCVLEMDEAPAFIYQGKRVHQRKEIRMYLQRIAIGVVAAALMAGSTVAFAQSDAAKKPLGKMTCEDFLGFEESFKPKVVYWAVAYGQGGKPESAGVNVAGIEKMVPVLIDGCKKAPKESFWEKVKAEVKKLEKKL